jgi:prefoldin alpha subunit
MEMQMEEDQNIIREYEHYQGQAEAYGKNIELINSNLTELGSVEASLDQLKDVDKDSEALVPIGGGSFVKARIVDNKSVIVDIGTGIAVKKSLPNAKEALKTRIKELEEVKAEHMKRLQGVLNRIGELEPRVKSIVSPMQREG